MIRTQTPLLLLIITDISPVIMSGEYKSFVFTPDIKQIFSRGKVYLRNLKIFNLNEKKLRLLLDFGECCLQRIDQSGGAEPLLSF